MNRPHLILIMTLSPRYLVFLSRKVLTSSACHNYALRNWDVLYLC